MPRKIKREDEAVWQYNYTHNFECYRVCIKDIVSKFKEINILNFENENAFCW